MSSATKSLHIRFNTNIKEHRQVWLYLQDRINEDLVCGNKLIIHALHEYFENEKSQLSDAEKRHIDQQIDYMISSLTSRLERLVQTFSVDINAGSIGRAQATPDDNVRFEEGNGFSAEDIDWGFLGVT